MLRSLTMALAVSLAATAVASADALDDAAAFLRRNAPWSAGAKTPPEIGAEAPEDVGRRTPSQPIAAAAGAIPHGCRVPPVPSTTDGANKACLALAGPLAAQQGDTLILRMDDGTRKSFKDKDPSGDSGYGFALVDFNETTHLFTVADVGLDSATYRLVDGRTGAITEVGKREPFVSPDGAWRFEMDRNEYNKLLFAAADLKAPVWDAVATKTEQDGLAVVGWRDDKTLELTRKDKHFDLARAEDGRWSIRETASPSPSVPRQPTRKGVAKDIARCGIEGDHGQTGAGDASDACTARLGEMVERADGKLIVQLETGKSTTFVDTHYGDDKDAPDSFLSSDVVAYSRAAHVFVLAQYKGTGLGTTSTTFLTVDSRSGAAHAFDTYPYVSPDGSVALAIAKTGEVSLLDLASKGNDPAWQPPTKAAEEVSPHTVFLQWDDARTVRVLVDDARILTVSRDGAGMWSAAATPLVKLFEALSKNCAIAKKSDEASEVRCLATIPEVAARVGKVLTLKLEDGRAARMVDRPADNHNAVHYRLVGYGPEQHQFIVSESFYEGVGCLIVDSISGELTHISNLPAFSPDASSFLDFTHEDGVGPPVAIFSNGPHPRMVWSFDTNDGRLPDVTLVGWLDASRVKLKIDQKTVVVTRDSSGAWQSAPATKKPRAASSPTGSK